MLYAYIVMRSAELLRKPGCQEQFVGTSLERLCNAERIEDFGPNAQHRGSALVDILP